MPHPHDDDTAAGIGGDFLKAFLSPKGIASALTFGGGLASGIIGAITAERALDAQRTENRRAEKLQLELYGQQFDESRRQFNAELQQRKRESKQTAKSKQADNALSMSNRMISGFNENPRTAQSFYEIADRRRK